jgi:hypothetical protein
MNTAGRQLLESSARFPYAMLAFGMQQGARVLSDRRGAARSAEASFYVVSQAMQRQLNDFLLRGFQVGDAIQREIVDTVSGIGRPSTRGSAWASEIEDILRPCRVLPRRNLRLALQELRNKTQVYDLVRHAKGASRAPNESQFPLMPRLEQAYRRPDFERIWAVEGLGHDYAAAALADQGGAPQGILISGPATSLPGKALTMVHAGMGLALAQSAWDGVTPYDLDSCIAGVIRCFDGACARSSRDGYAGAARESLGLATGSLEPLMVEAADRVMRATAPELVGYFWHGAGRALYFSATHFIPGLSSPWRGLLNAAPHRTGACNLIAGLAWATALVNMRHPEIVAEVLATVERAVLETGAFASGVSSALMMAYDVEPANPWIPAFLGHVPEDQGVAALWKAFVRKPGDDAFARIYPDLKGGNRLEELFQFAPSGRGDAAAP